MVGGASWYCDKEVSGAVAEGWVGEEGSGEGEEEEEEIVVVGG